MILDLIDEEKTPELSAFDRGVLVLHSLSVTNRPQLEKITGWSNDKIDSLLKRLRQREQERGEWLISWQPKRQAPYCYTLGTAAIKHAKELRREYVADDEIKPVGAQWQHYMLINEVLIRVLESDLREELEAWHGPRETGLWFYHETGADTNSLPKTRPDAVLEMAGGQTFAIEADLGTIPTPRMRSRLSKYLMLASHLSDMPNLVFIATTESRRRQLARCLDRVLQESVQRLARKDWSISFLLPGEVVDFLSEWLRVSASEPHITRVK